MFVCSPRYTDLVLRVQRASSCEAVDYTDSLLGVMDYTDSLLGVATFAV